jgi:hypothetical protein
MDRIVQYVLSIDRSIDRIATGAEADALKAFCDTDCVFHEFMFARTDPSLKRAPKCEFARDDTVGVYRWGQTCAEYDNARPMPEFLRTMTTRLPGGATDTKRRCCHGSAARSPCSWVPNRSVPRSPTTPL